MGDIYNDSCLEKVRANAGKCGACGKASYHPNHDRGEGRHAYVDGATEPIFVFRAQDETAVLAVQYWMNHLNPDLPPEKREEAAQWCGKALAWPKKKQPD